MKQLQPARNMRIKNHVTPKGKALNSQLSAKFGITLADFEKACMGDLTSIQRIGELNKQATFMTEYAPKSHIPHPQLSQIKKAIKVVHNN